MSKKKIKLKFKRLSLTLGERLVMASAIFGTAARACSEDPESNGPHPLTSKATWIMGKALDAIKYDEIAEMKEEKEGEEDEKGEVEVPDEELEATTEFKLKSAVYVFIKKCMRHVRWSQLAYKNMAALSAILEKLDLDEELDKFMESQFKDDEEEWELEEEE